MPSKSEAQRRLMAAAAHSPQFANRAGIPIDVAKEFNDADERKTKRRKLVALLIERDH
jgi:hypothetical protein